MGLLRWLLDALGLGTSADRTFQRSDEYRPSAERDVSSPIRQPATTSKTPDQTASAPATKRTTDPAAFQAGQFAPISRGDLKQQAGKLGPLWQNPWMGRRDVIPPAEDPRTSLIDRAMVSQGLISPEELQEIHEVGAEMATYRPDFAEAAHAAGMAVQQSAAEREALKQQKKAESARRKEQRQADIALRKRTDIIFLGRGVSKGLADRRANLERLQQHNLPALATPADVATALEMDVSRLRWLSFHNVAAQRTHYVQFDIPKKDGSTRTLAAPLPWLAQAQKWILAEILQKVPVHEAAHGFVRGRNTVTAATPHVGQAVLIGCDLVDFFPTISVFRVMGVFRSLGYSPAVATILALLCTECPRRQVTFNGQTYHVATGERCLPQGACTSPALSNLVSRRLDKRLTGLASKHQANYTRYADDLSLSGPAAMDDMAGKMLASVRHIVQEEGFALNPAKTRIQRPNTRQSVTGVVVNERPGAPRPLVRRLRAILHRAKLEGLESQNRENHPHFASWLQGMIAYVSMVNKEQGAKLQAAWDQLQ